MADKRLSARIYGRVHGVGFRYFTREIACELGVVGYVRNASDGAVEVVAEGNEGLLARLLGILREGPSHAEVTDIEVSWEEPTNDYDRFFVRS